MKNTAKKDKLKKLIRLRTKVVNQIKDLEQVRFKANQEILSLYESLNITGIEIDGYYLKRMVNETPRWESEDVLKYLTQKLGNRVADKAVITETMLNYVVDENEILRLVREKKVSMKNLKKYITVIKSRPYLKALVVKKEEA